MMKLTVLLGMMPAGCQVPLGITTQRMLDLDDVRSPVGEDARRRPARTVQAATSTTRTPSMGQMAGITARSDPFERLKHFGDVLDLTSMAVAELMPSTGGAHGRQPRCRRLAFSAHRSGSPASGRRS